MKRTTLALFALSLPIMAIAQGEVSGIVVDPQGNPVAAATVQAYPG